MRLLGFFLLLLYPMLSHGQSDYFYKDHPAYHIADRLQLKNLVDSSLHLGVKHFYRKELIDAVLPFEATDAIYSSKDLNDLHYLKIDNPQFLTTDLTARVDGRLLKHFYKEQAWFFYLDKPDFSLIINPIINFRIGKEFDNGDPIFQNTRGLNIRGLIDDKIYFSTSLFENQANFISFIDNRIEQNLSIPGQAFYKDYESSVISSFSGYDYLNAEGYVGLPLSKSLTLELGHASHSIGHGYRSLLLNDYATNYFFLKLKLQVWKIYYHSIFAELAPISSQLNDDNNLLPKKYMASHYLSFKASNKFEIGLFESVVFSRQDQFELQYLNPIILYRTVEQFIDSPDNVLIGLNWQWNFAKNTSLYSQIIIDEFKLSEIIDGNGWWGNKYGFQLGIKHIDVLGIDHLDLLVEYNRVRPFTYSHRDTVAGYQNYSLANYSHYGQELAHPLGSNFHESVVKLRYVPNKKLLVQAKIIYALQGENEIDVNNGGNLFIPSGTRSMDYGFNLGDGVRKKINSLSLDLSYQIFHNYFVDLNYLYRKSDSDNDLLDLNSQYLGVGFRMNVSNYKIDH